MLSSLTMDGATIRTCHTALAENDEPLTLRYRDSDGEEHVATLVSLDANERSGGAALFSIDGTITAVAIFVERKE